MADEARFCGSCGSLVSDAEGQAAVTASMDGRSFAYLEKLLRQETQGDFEVGPMLGRGGMAVVYLATEVELRRKVALKVLPPELTFGHGVERFKREARTAAALDHPNIIPIYRISNKDTLFWYAMKFLEGRSLEDALREDGAMSLPDTIAVIEQVADALDYAHARKVIHRDIKPANVMLDNRNRVVVTDFGIAKALSEGKLTATDSVIGTPYFMSPEQGMGKPVSGASDQYSVGVMIFRMLAGHVPFDGDSAIDILHKHCMFPAPLLSESAPHLPEHVCAAVDRALSKTADMRFATVGDLVAALKGSEFDRRPLARPSIATLLVDSRDVNRSLAPPGTAASAERSGARSGGRSAARAASAAARSNDGTVQTPYAPAPASARPAVAPAPKASRVKMFALIAVAVGLVSAGVVASDFLRGADSQSSALGSSNSADAPDATPSASAGSAAVGAGVAGTESTVPPQSVRPDSPVAQPTPSGPTSVVESPPRPPARPTTRPRSVASGTTVAGTTVAGTERSPTTTPATIPPVQRPAADEPPPPAPAAAAAATGTLRLVLPVPATVVIDGQDQGEKSRLEIALAGGTHIVVARKDGYVTRTETVEIRAGEPTTLRIQLERRP